jgi:hypothetical protein
MDDTSYQRPASFSPDSPPHLLDLKSRPLSESFVGLAGHSWGSPNVSRSPSPSSRDERSSRDENDSQSASSVSSSASPTKSNGAEDAESKNESLRGQPRFTRSPSLLGKARRPLSVFIRSSSSDPLVPSASAVKTPYVGSGDSVGSLTDRPPPKKVKDELWEGYRLLENDFQR